MKKKGISCNIVQLCVAKCDSAASRHYWRDQDMGVTANIVPFSGHPVTLPDNTHIIPNKKCTIPIGFRFSKTAKTATNLPHLRSASLIAVGPLCDDGKLVVFDQNVVRDVEPNPQLHAALNGSTTLLQGRRNEFDGCWDIELTKTFPLVNGSSSPTHNALLSASSFSYPHSTETSHQGYYR